jgi:cystathionine beta-lyase family protein involved in aluminum resistance
MGGYVAGRREWVEKAALQLNALGRDSGANLIGNRPLFQGLLMAPHTVAQALKTAVFAAEKLRELGYSVDPLPEEERYDIIQTVRFGAPESLLRFAQGIQRGSPVDSFAVPEPWDMPGYDHQVVMAAGSFIQGASIELSCDAPMRPPYTAYLQGGLTYELGKLGVLKAIEKLCDYQSPAKP